MIHSKKMLVAGGSLVGLAVIAATVYGAVYFANHESDKVTSVSQVCPAGHHNNHQVIIENNKVSPGNTVAPLCDTLTITNRDNVERLVAFGPHEHHTPYDGITERILTKGQSLTVSLVQAGNFRFHDHYHDEVQGTFTVTSAK